MTEEQKEIEEAANEAIENLQEAGLEDVVILGRAFGVKYINLDAVSDDFSTKAEMQGVIAQANHRLTLDSIIGEAEEKEEEEMEEEEK